jgi:predicted PolB exonuclease-like 3'-5' exonuclease
MSINDKDKAESGEIIVYRSIDGSTNMNIHILRENIWLNQAQIANLFGTKRQAITKHLINIYKSGELKEDSTSSILEHLGNEGKQIYQTKYYNLDAVISVGYRVNSIRATQFRIWATQVLSNYLLKGYAINQRIENIEKKVYEHDRQIEALVMEALPPKEGIFYDGQIFEAYEKVVSFIKSAKKSIVLIDNYIDETVLILLSKRRKGVNTKIYTHKMTEQLKLDLKKHNDQYEPIEVIIFDRSHDRFLIIDGKTVYHIGASLKDLGKKWFAFSKIEIGPENILNKLP